MTGIYFDGFDLKDLWEEMEASTAKTRREAKKVLRQGAKDILQDSQKMAPVDEHNLELAHRLLDVRLNQDFAAVEIVIDGFIGGRDVSEYAMIMHEFLAPFGAGTYNLGMKSMLKDQGADNEHRVGGKFLERAVDLNELRILEAIKRVLLGGEADVD